MAMATAAAKLRSVSTSAGVNSPRLRLSRFSAPMTWFFRRIGTTSSAFVSGTAST